MVNIYSVTENEADSGLEGSSEKAIALRNSQPLIKDPDNHLELQDDHENSENCVERVDSEDVRDNSEKQLELQERYDFAIKEGFNALAAVHNEISCERSQIRHSSGESTSSVCSSEEGDSSGAVCPSATKNDVRIDNCEGFHVGDVVNNNVIVKVEAEKSHHASFQELIENGQEKFITIGKWVAGAVSVILVLVTVIVVVEIAQLRNGDVANNNPHTGKLPALPTDGAHYVADNSGPGNISWVPRTNCGLPNPLKSSGIVNLTLPSDAVIVSHTVTPECTSIEKCCARLSTIQSFHMTFTYDFGYHFLIGSDGNVYEGRKWDQEGAHTKGGNCKIGVAFIGNFMGAAPVQKQVDAAFKLFQGLVSANLLSPDYTIFGQKDVKPTESPGKVLIELMANWPHYRREDQIVKAPCSKLTA